MTSSRRLPAGAASRHCRTESSRFLSLVPRRRCHQQGRHRPGQRRPGGDRRRQDARRHRHADGPSRSGSRHAGECRRDGRRQESRSLHRRHRAERTGTAGSRLLPEERRPVRRAIRKKYVAHIERMLTLAARAERREAGAERCSTSKRRSRRNTGRSRSAANAI